MLAPACGQGPSSPLTIYSGRTENLVRPLLDRFVRETGIDIDVKYGDSPNLALLIAEEGKRSPADVFLSQSPGTVGFLDEKGLLEKLDPETLEDVDSRFEAPDGRWVGVTGRVRVLVY
ncbi:MAG: extracellular solute-binding protein, partial [Actinomycetota bacterium]